MSVQPGPTDKRYVANGVTTIYAVPFLVIEPGDLKVYLNGVLQTSGYTQTGVGQPTSSVTFAIAPTGDLYFVLEIPFQRLVDYQENGDFLSSTVNRDFDRIWQALKQLLSTSGRSPVLGVNDVDGNGWYRAKGNGIRNLRDPIELQDAATLGWASRFISDLIAAIQGPINNALNIFYQWPNGTAHVVQDLSSSTGTSGIGRGAGTLEDALLAIEADINPEGIVSVVTVDSVLDRTVGLSDSHVFNVCNHASANIRTIPPQVDVAWKNHTEIEFFNDSLTPLLIAPGTGVSIVTPAGRVAKVATKGASKLKRISANRWLMNGDNEAALPASFVNSFGDSITYGVGATIPYDQHSYIYHLNTLRGWAIANRAVSASMTYDQAAELFRYTIEENSTSTIMIGTNDRTRYGTASQYRMDCFKEAHMACLVWMGVADLYRVYPNSTAATYVGTWSNSSYGKIVSKYSGTVNNTVTVPFSGKTVYVHYLKVDGYVGTVDVKVDGVTKATINVAGPGVTTNLGVTQGPGLIRITGLIDGPHTLLLTLSTMNAGSAFIFHGISVPPETLTKPRANLMTIIKTATPANDADIVTFNNMIKDNYNLLRFRDGLDVVLSDSWAVIDPATDLYDNLHPNDAGHLKIGRKAALDF